MVQISQSSYDDFKSAFSALGGSRKTAVITSPNGPTGGAFNALAILDDCLLQVGLDAQPDSFATDFPQAVAVDQYGTNA